MTGSIALRDCNGVSRLYAVRTDDRSRYFPRRDFGNHVVWCVMVNAQDHHIEIILRLDEPAAPNGRSEPPSSRRGRALG